MNFSERRPRHRHAEAVPAEGVRTPGRPREERGGPRPGGCGIRRVCDGGGTIFDIARVATGPSHSQGSHREASPEQGVDECVSKHSPPASGGKGEVVDYRVLSAYVRPLLCFLVSIKVIYLTIHPRLLFE
jgi:hypothetical protein